MRRFASPLVMLAALYASSAAAQGTAAPATGNGGRVEITADQSLEWRQDDRAYLARGNATATRGDVTIVADVMRAFYRDTGKSAANSGPIGDSDIYKLRADGDVRIRSQDNQVFGAAMDYDVDRRIAVMSGEGLRLETKQDVVTAVQALEYWEADKRAVARGDAIVRRSQGDAMRADLLTAQLKENEAGELVVDRVEATGNVTITTKQDVIRGAQGVYDVTSGKALVVGNVQISRSGNQLNGQRAEVDLNSGVSRLIGSGGPVRGLLNEQDAKPKASSPPPPKSQSGATP
jgi:lipopolysaccharide export system protein LptA